MHALKIKLERSGGFAGMTMRFSLEDRDLPEEEAQRLRQMLQQARFFELPPSLRATSPQPDRFTYRLTVSSDEKEHTVELSESAIPHELRPLLDYLNTLARRTRRPSG